MIPNKQNGYTLIEMLLVAVLLSVVGGAVFTAMVQGSKLWTRANQRQPEIEIEIFFEKVQNEIRNLVRFSKGSLTGDKNGLSLISVRSSREMIQPKSESFYAPEQLAKIKYEFDPAKRAVVKRIQGYADLLTPKLKPGNFHPELQEINKMEVSYGLKDHKSNSVIWRGNWALECLPDALKISLNYTNGAPRQVTRIMPVPLGNCGSLS